MLRGDLADRDPRRRAHRARPRGVALGAGRARAEHDRRQPLLPGQAREHVTVAAVVARAADDRYPPRARVKRAEQSERGRARALHQLRARDVVPLPPRTQGDFSLLVQRKVTKRKDTPDGAKPPAHPRLWGPRLTHATSCRGVWSRTSMSATPAGRFPKALRCLGAPYGDPKKPTSFAP